MKKIISLLLALTMVFALCACGQKEPEYDPKEAFEDKVCAAVYAIYLFGARADNVDKVDNYTSVVPFLHSIEVDGNVYTGIGTVDFVDDHYNVNYSAGLTAVYEYNEEDRSFTKISLDIGPLNK